MSRKIKTFDEWRTKNCYSEKDFEKWCKRKGYLEVSFKEAEYDQVYVPEDIKPNLEDYWEEFDSEALEKYNLYLNKFRRIE